MGISNNKKVSIVPMRILAFLGRWAVLMVKGRDRIGTASRFVEVLVVGFIGYSFWQEPSFIYLVGSSSPLSWGLLAIISLGVFYAGCNAGLAFIESGDPILTIENLEWDENNRMERLTVFNRGPCIAHPIAFANSLFDKDGSCINPDGPLPLELLWMNQVTEILPRHRAKVDILSIDDGSINKHLISNTPGAGVEFSIPGQMHWEKITDYLRKKSQLFIEIEVRPRREVWRGEKVWVRITDSGRKYLERKDPFKRAWHKRLWANKILKSVLITICILFGWPIPMLIGQRISGDGLGLVLVVLYFAGWSFYGGMIKLKKSEERPGE